YFKPLFAQVTNPPIDPIREALVMSLETYIGSEQNLLDETPEHARQLKLHQPILTNQELDKSRNIEATGKIKIITLKALYKVSEGEAGLRDAMEQLCVQASQAIEEGYAILILSDRGVDQEWAPIPTLLACSGVHHHLVREGTRTRAGLVIES